MQVEDLVEAIRLLETVLPPDVEGRLRGALGRESGISKMVVEAILENVLYAKERGVPMCQDTGILEFFVRCSNDHEEIRNKIAEALRRATREVPLRANTVNPFTRENEGTNLGRSHPIVHFEGRPLNEGDIEMDIIAKGAGSENVSASFMLDPMQGVEGIKKAVVQAVQKAGAKPCPPVVVGVGVGGNLERSAYLAKKALLRPLNEKNPNRNLAELEEELIEKVNALGIGPMGLGGSTTTIGVLLEWGHCHTASLPVSVNIQCWALRRISLEWQGKNFRILR
ncbi:MAG: fumarate hydratase [Candidatus Methanomethyliales bacterium]|nr:fumarate hydratase [Candidatus Methanomethylicales archaeon]